MNRITLHNWGALALLLLVVALALFGGAPADPLAGAGVLALGTLDMTEVKTALGELKTTILGRLEPIEKKMGEFGERRAELDAALALATRPGGTTSSAAASVSPEQRKSLEAAVRALFAGDQAAADRHFAEFKGMNWGTSTDGGYLSLPNFSDTFTRIQAEVSPFAALARTINIDQGMTWEEIIDRGEAATSWVGELDPRGNTAHPELGKFYVEAFEIFAQPSVSQRLVDASSVDVVGWLQNKVAEAFALAESVAFHSGDGVARPRGILTYPTAATADATRAWGTIEHIATGAAGAFPTSSTSVNPADVLVNVQSAMKGQYRAGAVWMMNRGTAGVVRKLKDAEGRHVWTDQLTQGQPPILLGHPVVLSEQMPAVSSDSLSIAFLNPAKCYTILRRLGVRHLVDPYSNKPMVNVFVYQRVGGGVHNFEAIKLLKFS